jgi:hypothetical protein
MTAHRRRSRHHTPPALGGDMRHAFLKALARRVDRVASPETRIAIPTGIVTTGELKKC